MITVVNSSTRNHDHTLSDDLWLVLRDQRQTAGDLAAVAAAHQRILKSCNRTAFQMLRSWFVPNAAMEAEDVVQQWHLAMLEGGFERWDTSQSVGAYAYQVLRRICIATLKRHVRMRIVPIVTDLEHAAVDPTTSIDRAEDLLILRAAIAQLHPTLRSEVTAWLEEGFPCDLHSKARRRRSRALWRAKQKLRELLMEAFEPDCTRKLAKSSERAADLSPMNSASCTK